MDNLTNSLKKKNNNDKTKETHEKNKQNRYITSYYTCHGVSCNHDWRKVPKLFSSKCGVQPIKEDWKHLNLVPKYYENKCVLCSFLSKLNKNKLSIKELLRIYKKQGGKFKYTDDDHKFIKNINYYNKIVEFEKKEINDMIICNNKHDNNSLVVELKEELLKMKEYYDTKLINMEQRIKHLEHNSSLN